MVQFRKHSLATNEIYHIFNKSIAGFKIFNNEAEFLRIILNAKYYQQIKPAISLSRFIRDYGPDIESLENDDRLVEIISYCIMPTHIHFILKQIKDNGISTFMSHTLNSYTRFFNFKHKRKGPLWQGRFKSVLINKEEQLMHLTRYIHLNPVTSFLVDDPKEWIASSFNEYIEKNDDNGVCRFNEILKIEPVAYEKFVKQRASYQRNLGLIKNLMFD